MKWILRHIAVLVLVFQALPSVAAQRLFYGRIINTAGVGVPLGVVESHDRRYRFAANDSGVFSFRADPDSLGYLSFSAQGYVAKEFLAEDLADDSIIVELNKKQNMLAGATVGAKGNREREATSGISSGWHSAGCYLNVHDELAIYLEADKAKNGMIKEVGTYIIKEGIPSSNFRLHIYARDSATGGPGEDITDSELVVHARRGNEWVTANLADHYIQAHGGVFVSVEWLVDNTDAFHPFNIPFGTANYYSGVDSFRTVFNGQVVGMTWQDRQPKIYRRYATDLYAHKDEGKWQPAPPLRGGHRGKGWIVPMIYYTYSYVER